MTNSPPASRVQAQSIYIILPVKSLHQSKTRLAPILPAEERALLMHQLLYRTLVVLGEVAGIDRIIVVSSDPVVLDTARLAGADTLDEGMTQGLNAAVTSAVARATAEAATHALILPADLPFMQAEEVERMIAEGIHDKLDDSRQPPVLICPDRHSQGTNALLLSLPTQFNVQYGADSFARHQQEAARLGLPARVIHATWLAFDLDTEEDWRSFQVKLRDQTHSLLTRHDIPTI